MSCQSLVISKRKVYEINVSNIYLLGKFSVLVSLIFMCRKHTKDFGLILSWYTYVDCVYLYSDVSLLSTRAGRSLSIWMEKMNETLISYFLPSWSWGAWSWPQLLYTLKLNLVRMHSIFIIVCIFCGCTVDNNVQKSMAAHPEHVPPAGCGGVLILLNWYNRQIVVIRAWHSAHSALRLISLRV